MTDNEKVLKHLSTKGSEDNPNSTLERLRDDICDFIGVNNKIDSILSLSNHDNNMGTTIIRKPKYDNEVLKNKGIYNKIVQFYIKEGFKVREKDSLIVKNNYSKYLVLLNDLPEHFEISVLYAL